VVCGRLGLERRGLLYEEIRVELELEFGVESEIGLEGCASEAVIMEYRNPPGNDVQDH
jgi:hypothetical protein